MRSGRIARTRPASGSSYSRRPLGDSDGCAEQPPSGGQIAYDNARDDRISRPVEPHAAATVRMKARTRARSCRAPVAQRVTPPSSSATGEAEPRVVFAAPCRSSRSAGTRRSAGARPSRVASATIRLSVVCSTPRPSTRQLISQVSMQHVRARRLEAADRRRRRCRCRRTGRAAGSARSAPAGPRSAR